MFCFIGVFLLFLGRGYFGGDMVGLVGMFYFLFLLDCGGVRGKIGCFLGV